VLGSDVALRASTASDYLVQPRELSHEAASIAVHAAASPRRGFLIVTAPIKAASFDCVTGLLLSASLG